MNLTLVKRLCIIGLLVVGGIALAQKLPKLDVGSQFALVLLGGAAIAVMVAKWIVPIMGDAVGTFFYSSGEVATPSENMQAAARLAQGDYEGAIAEYQSILESKPDDTLAIAEITKIRAEKLHDPQGALSFIQQQLESRDWSADNAAFLMFRIVELHMHVLHDFARAQSVLEQVITSFPNTRHSANAHHKIHEVQQAQFKAVSQSRNA